MKSSFNLLIGVKDAFDYLEYNHSIRQVCYGDEVSINDSLVIMAIVSPIMSKVTGDDSRTPVESTSKRSQFSQLTFARKSL